MSRGVLAALGDHADTADVARAAERSGLTAVALAPGHVIYAGDAIPVRTMADGALVFGDIFSRSGATCQSPSDGWGNYLAFSHEGSVHRVDRAPITGMPLYWARRGDSIICATDLALLDGLLPRAALDWEFVAQALTFINLRTDRTGLTALRELLPGMRLAFDGHEAGITPLWSPWTYVAKASFLGVAEFAPELERRVIASVKSWSASRGDILLELSGGLDSSIVAAALAAAGANCSAITFVTPGADGDERHYARAVAAHCGFDLVEMAHDDAGVDLIAPPAILGPRPGAYSVLGGIDRAFEGAVPGRGGSVFGGIGGDNIFEFDGTVAPINDAFDTFGISRRSFEALRDGARSGGATIWEAARLAYRARRKGARRGWRRDTQYLLEDALPDRAFAHPWDEGADIVSQAKRNHVESLRRILDFLDRPERWHGRDVVAPLLSQPVVELCLAIPSWTWFTGGRDRAVARAAFARRLPAEIVWRRGKGRLESMCAAAYLRQRRGLRELLLGGRLASRGLLDLPAIEAYLDRDLVEGDFDYFRLIEIADVERWVRAVESSSFLRPSLDQR